MRVKCLVGVFLCVVLWWPAVRAESPKIRRILSDFAAVKGPYTFAVLGDNRSGDRVYAKIIRRMMAREPMFVVNTGDLIPNAGDREEWRNFWRVSEPIDVPHFLTPGNHDIDSMESQDIWRDEVDLPGDETYYKFVVEDDLFVVLDTCEPEHDRKVAGRQLAWLRAVLNPSRYRHQFVFLHYPLFLWHGASHRGRSLDRYPELRDRLHRLFVRKGVDAVFAGHEHTYKRMEVDGIDYVVTGGAGAPLYSGFSHFMIVRVKGQRVEVKVIDREGYLRDEYLIAGYEK